MMMEEKDGFSMVKTNASSNVSRIDALKQKINNEDYLSEAIQRIAYVLSNEIAGIPGGGRTVERKG